MILIAISFNDNEGKTGIGGRGPKEIFETTSFKSKEDALFDIKSAFQKGYFRSFAEKGSGPEPQGPP